MMKLFGDVTPFVKRKPKIQVPRPDNFVFRLHYKLTFVILCVSCILISSYSYIDKSGAAIQCMLNKGSEVPDDVINRFCWIQSTFTLPKYYEGEKGVDFIHHGVGPYVKGEDETVYHAYYQWVPLMLFFQALCFYAPHWVWKQLEGGRLNKLIVSLKLNETQLDLSDSSDKERKEKVQQLAEYMNSRQDLKRIHEIWAWKFFACECLNFINVVAQIFITDAFLGGEFSQYGIHVLQFAGQDPEDRVDPMSKVFPRMTKCTFYKYGGSGSLMTLDALCVLGMNILNEKIYVFLWFWFVILSIITGIMLIVRVVQYFMKDTRDRFMMLESRGNLNVVDKESVRQVVDSVSYPDWLILYYLAQSMDKKNFGDLMKMMAESLPMPGMMRTSDVNSDSPDGTLRKGGGYCNNGRR